jgi:hypothetical protein
MTASAITGKNITEWFEEVSELLTCIRFNLLTISHIKKQYAQTENVVSLHKKKDK